jgi:hypothetical protein
VKPISISLSSPETPVRVPELASIQQRQQQPIQTLERFQNLLLRQLRNRQRLPMLQPPNTTMMMCLLCPTQAVPPCFR